VEAENAHGEEYAVSKLNVNDVALMYSEFVDWGAHITKPSFAQLRDAALSVSTLSCFGSINEANIKRVIREFTITALCIAKYGEISLFNRTKVLKNIDGEHARQEEEQKQNETKRTRQLVVSRAISLRASMRINNLYTHSESHLYCPEWMSKAFLDDKKNRNILRMAMLICELYVVPDKYAQLSPKELLRECKMDKEGVFRLRERSYASVAKKENIHSPFISSMNQT